MADKTKSDKKKRSLIAWLVVITFLAVIIANIVVWKNYFSEESQIEVLKNEVAMVNQQISQTEQPPSGLEAKLQEATNNLTLALQVFPENVDRTDVVDFIINTAAACDVQIVPLISQGVVTSQSGQSYIILKYSGTVTGNLSNATNFITMLRNGNYPTMIITECIVDRVTGLDTVLPDGDIEVTLELSFSLYTSSVQVVKDTVS